MAYFFSPSRLAFFHSAVPCSDVPDDLRPVTDERHEALMEEVWHNGKQIVADANGDPDTAARDA